MSSAPRSGFLEPLTPLYGLHNLGLGQIVDRQAMDAYRVLSVVTLPVTDTGGIGFFVVTRVVFLLDI